MSTQFYAVTYSRVSTEEQARQGVSLDHQKKQNRRYYEVREVPWVMEEISESGSGKNLEREGMQKIIFGIKEGRIKCLIVYKLDRLTRSLQDMDALIELFEKHEVQFMSVQENIDTKTATGRLFIRLVILFAQWEREKNSERTKEGLTETWEQGTNMSKPIFGYKAIKRKVKGKTRIVKWVPDPEQSEIVNELYDLIVRNFNLSELARKYDMSRQKIKYILMNPAYLGKRTFRGEVRDSNTHDAIVSQEQFDRAQKRLESLQK